MSALLRGELLKLRTTRTFAALVGAALALSLLVVVLSALLADDFRDRPVRDLFAADFASLFILLLGIMGLAGEWRHRTIAGTVLAAPNRLRLLAAKSLAYAAAGALLSAIVTVAIMVVGSAILAARGLPTATAAELADVLWRNLLVAALLGALGVGLGGVVRSQVAAIVGVLVMAFAVEPTLFALAPEVAAYGPTGGAPAAIQDVDPLGDRRSDRLLAPGVAVLVLCGWIALLFAAAAARMQRGDIV